jgi:epoxyqueuosine reductase
MAQWILQVDKSVEASQSEGTVAATNMDLIPHLTTVLTSYGFNLIGTASVSAYEARVPVQYHVTPLLPQAKAIIVIGNGGGEFWSGFRTYCQARPGYLQEHEHPLDDYTAEMIENALTPILQQSGAQYRYLYPFRFWSEPVSFMHLAQAAGIAGPSILGVVIHPVYGPWMALRAAVLIDQVLDIAPSAPGFDPCSTCSERACMAACPASAISVEKGWDIPACVQHRLQVQEDCVDRCHARYHCVYGRAHRYPPDELAYHQQRSFAEMRKYFEKGKR